MLCDVCTQSKSNRPCSDCREVRLGMHESALMAEQEWDFRHKHVNELQGDGELTDITDFTEVSIRTLDPKVVAKYGIQVGDIVIASSVVITE